MEQNNLDKRCSELYYVDNGLTDTFFPTRNESDNYLILQDLVRNFSDIKIKKGLIGYEITLKNNIKVSHYDMMICICNAYIAVRN